MAEWHPIQADFSGGEISARFQLRPDDFVRRSVIEMENFMPNTQGTVERVPGTRHFLELTDEANARIIPYLTAGNERAMLLFTPLRVQMFPEISKLLSYATSDLPAGPPGTIVFRKQIVPNNNFRGGAEPWTLEPPEYLNENGDSQGSYWGPGAIHMVARIYKAGDIDTCVVTNVATVDEPTDVITLVHTIALRLLRPLNSGYELNVKLEADGGEIYNEDYVSGQVAGSSWDVQTNVNLPTAAWTGDITITITMKATLIAPEKNSTVRFTILDFDIFADGTATLGDVDLVTPYSANDIEDLHYIQSPYADKEMVVCHPKHEPHRLYFDTGGAAYVFEPIPFTGGTLPSEWSSNNYPATCTSYHGRLILAGGQTKPVLGGPVAAVTETVWGTKVGEWTVFSEPGEVNPNDSIEFTAIYRSPIQWTFGHKTLLIGALEMEYSASGDGIFSPGDLGVNLHSTSGSKNVQPAAFGEGVLFAGDNGRKVRAMNYSDEEGGWIAADVSIAAPHIFTSGVKRMARLRNPHQICITVQNDGTVGMFHSEGALAGWSRVKVSDGAVKDVCVIANDDGVDIPYFIIERVIGGVRTRHIEAVPNWVGNTTWDFLSGSTWYNFTVPTNILPGLERFEGHRLQVVGDRNYLGFFTVTGGEITLLDKSGNPTPVTIALAGMPHRSRMRLMPPLRRDPAAKSRYSELAIRTLYSSRPIVQMLGQPNNKERSYDRTPGTPMSQSEPMDVLDQSEFTKLNFDPMNVVEIIENIPVRCEVVGVFGKLTSNSL
jgi:hypothetical protein